MHSNDMVTFLSIDSKDSDAAQLRQLDQALGNKEQAVFLLVYMEGCGPCNATRPEWAKLRNVVGRSGAPAPIVVADINKDAVDGLRHFRQQLAGFPTMLLFQPGKGGPIAYEDAEGIGEKDRTVDSFVRWIKRHAPVHGTGRRSRSRSKRSSTKSKRITRSLLIGGQRRRRWSAKYKRSINCRRPRGFSQRQYCRYGRRH